MFKHFHTSLYLAALVVTFGIGGVIIKYVVIDNSHRALSGIETMTAATANALSSTITYDASENSNFKETITASSSVFKITKDQRAIVYNLGLEQTDDKAILYCSVGNAGFTVLSLSSHGTLTDSDIIPLATNCNPGIYTIQGLVEAIHKGTISLTLRTEKILLK
jgi:hypothetical protein